MKEGDYMDRWQRERAQAIKNGSFEMATAQAFRTRAKSFIKREMRDGKTRLIGRTKLNKDFIEFEFLDDPGLEKLEARFIALTEKAKKELRKYFRK